MTSRPPLPKSLLTQTIATDLALMSSLMYLATFGIDDCWPNDVRNRNLLSPRVSSAASPPMICAIPASAASGAVTLTDPEERGPRRTYGSLSGALWTGARTTPGLDCESAWVTSSLRPRTPPLALISSIARSIPFFQLVPTVAPPPDSSATLASLMGAPDCANAAPVKTVASKTLAKIAGFIRFPPVIVRFIIASSAVLLRSVRSGVSFCHHVVECNSHFGDGRHQPRE